MMSTPALRAFGALLLRDLRVLRKQVVAFLLRVILQPLLLVFVFTYVFPKIGQGIGGTPDTAAMFSTLLVPGVIASATIFQGIQAVALPLVSEFGFTREIEDRVMAPLPVWAIAVQKILTGSIQGVLAAAVIFPMASLIPITPVHLHVRPLTLLPIGLLAMLVGSSLGLAIGTRAQPTQVSLVFSILVIPMTFLGATYYPWSSLGPIPWLKWFVLINPLVYMSEGLRMALTDVPHMNALAIYGALLGFVAVLGWLGITGFRKRVLD